MWTRRCGSVHGKPGSLLVTLTKAICHFENLVPVPMLPLVQIWKATDVVCVSRTEAAPLEAKHTYCASIPPLTCCTTWTNSCDGFMPLLFPNSKCHSNLHIYNVLI